MTEFPRGTTDELVASAAVEALLAARWESVDVLSRRPSRMAADLLRGHAAELATAPFVRDQVLSLALEAAARDMEAEKPPLDAGATFLLGDASRLSDERQGVREMVLKEGGQPVLAPAAVAAELEHRLAGERLPAWRLSLRLADEAHLIEALWDDPRLPADASVRLAMLCSIATLAQRAAELDPHRTRAQQIGASGARSARSAIGHLAAAVARWRRPSRVAAWLLAIGLLLAGAVAFAQ